MRIVERIPAHYETQEVEDFGRVYRWWSLNVSILAVSLSVFAGPLPCVLMPE